MTPDIIPARMLTPQVEICINRPPPRARDGLVRAYILEAARNMFVSHGRNGLTIRAFADCTRLAQATIRGHVSDMHHLFGLILQQHLTGIIAAIGAIPSGRGDDRARRRAEYFRYTRGICNVPTPLHFLWIRDRFSLPEDEMEPLEQHRRILGYMLGGELWEETLNLLDCPVMDLDRIETMLASITGSAATPATPLQPPAAAIGPRPPVLPTSLTTQIAPQITPQTGTTQPPAPARTPFRASLFTQIFRPEPIADPGEAPPDWDGPTWECQDNAEDDLPPPEPRLRPKPH